MPSRNIKQVTVTEATEALVVLPKHAEGDVGEQLSQQHQEEKAANRRNVHRNPRLLARQGLQLRGGDGDADSNFIQLLHLQGVNCPEVKPWMKKKTNKYTYHDIQNECLQVMALQLLCEVSLNIRDSAFF